MARSAFGYPGGKSRCAKYLLPVFPRHRHYAEVFSGAGHVLFAKQRAAGSETLNDVDADLINCHRFIRDEPERLIEALRDLPLNREQWRYFAKVFEPETPLERAMRWYYLVRVSYGCMVGRGYQGSSANITANTEHWWPRIRGASERLQGVDLTVGDFEEAIGKAPKDAFAFLDPPYVGCDVYEYNFEIDDHDRLAACLRRHRDRLRFLLVYDADPSIVARYRGWTAIHHLAYRYTMTRPGGRDRFPQLLLIRNYTLPRRRSKR